jgi:hypothetical protein
MKLDKECAEEFKALLSKYSPNFVQKFKKEVVLIYLFRIILKSSKTR